MNQNTHIIGDIVLFLTTKWKIPAHNLVGIFNKNNAAKAIMCFVTSFLGEYFHLHLHLLI